MSSEERGFAGESGPGCVLCGVSLLLGGKGRVCPRGRGSGTAGTGDRPRRVARVGVFSEGDRRGAAVWGMWALRGPGLGLCGLL
ncbi:MAG: hypothetical protein ACE5I5_07340 [Candidatus Heimdallarchaeota archaeon]